jgi:hypothetical protein
MVRHLVESVNDDRVSGEVEGVMIPSARSAKPNLLCVERRELAFR